MAENTGKKEYGAENITVLSGLEPVRKRPGMFIGSTDVRGLHHIAYEVIDNSIDECMAGHANSVWVTIEKDGWLTVEDNGRGIPVDIHPKEKKSALTVVLTILHAGGKFDKESYKVSGGLHGVGVSVTNALSEKLRAWVKLNSKTYFQEFIRGVPVEDVKIIGDSTGGTGTKISFYPDKEIFSTIEWDYETVAKKLKELAYLNKGVKIIFKDERTGELNEYHFEGGVKEFVTDLNRGKMTLHQPIYFCKEKDQIIIEAAVQYNTTFAEVVYSFANNINTHEGGTHLTGFRTALTRCLNTYAVKKNLIKEAELTSDDFREGLTAVISAKVPEPQFEGQTKTKLGNSEIKGIVDSITSEALTTFLEENPSVGKIIISKALDAARAREAARKAKELVRRKSALEFSTLPGKLSDCSSKEMEKCEVYFVEGDSAGGTARQARDKNFQAILPLKGKILNVEKSRLVKILGNEEIGNIITAIGAGLGEEFDAKKLRYGKIILMTDADVDGSHIACLLLTLFYRYMPQLIDTGRIYLAMPPLYKIQKGKKVEYAFDDAEKDKVVAQMGEDVSIQRYKGLGEMNAEQLWETTMNPAVRKLKHVLIEDAVAADEMFRILMGDEVEPRRDFIMKHAGEAELDI